MSAVSRFVCFFRHGIAENKEVVEEDFNRTLTSEGRKKLEYSAPNLHYLINMEKEILIWSSPLSRAVETAEIISRSLGGLPIIEQGFIVEGDYDQLLSEIESTTKDCTIIIVGHEPTLSTWVEQLTGSLLPFGKGACAGVQIKDAPEAQLLWFHQSKSLKNLRVIKDNPSNLLAILLRNSLNNMLSFHKAFLASPYDKENVHQLRVHTRQFRSTLNFLKPLLPDNVYQDARNPAKELFKQFSRLRELDVLLEEVELICNKEPDLLEDPEGVVELISKARLKEQRRLIHSSNQKKMRLVFAHLYQWVESVEWASLILGTEDLSSFVKKRSKKEHKKVAEKINQLDYTDIEAVHHVRLKAKHYRYVLKNFASLSEQNKKALKKKQKFAKILQKKLSPATDFHENILALHSFMHQELPEWLEKDLLTLIDYETKQLDSELMHLQENSTDLI